MCLPRQLAWVRQLVGEGGEVSAVSGRGLAKDGQALTSPEAIEARAVELAQAFLAQTLPAWQRRGVG